MDSRVRDLLRLGLLDYLLEDPNINVVLLTPASKDQEFLEEFSRDRVIIRNSKEFVLTRLQKAIITVKWALRYRWLVKIWTIFEQFVMPNSIYDNLFKELPPNLIILSDINKEREIPLYLNSRKKRIKTLGLIRSWDNILKRLYCRVDTLAVPNEINRREAIELELYQDSQVEVVGTPQFDPYFDPSVIIDREQYLVGLGLDPSKKLLLLATAGAKLGNIQTNWFDILLHAQENGEFSMDTQIVCRNHPGDSLGPFLNPKYVDRKGLYMDMPRRWLGSLGWSMTKEDVNGVANLLYHSDVVVQPASTIAIEAAIFDTPTLTVGFNEVLPEITDNSLYNWAFLKHFKPIVEQQLIPVANNREELISQICLYLNDPTLFTRQRKILVEKWIKPSDGNSSKRIADLILQLAQ